MCSSDLVSQFSRSVTSDSVTPWTAARQACLSVTNSQSLFKLMSIESVMPSFNCSSTVVASISTSARTGTVPFLFPPRPQFFFTNSYFAPNGGIVTRISAPGNGKIVHSGVSVPCSSCARCANVRKIANVSSRTTFRENCGILRVALTRDVVWRGAGATP